MAELGTSEYWLDELGKRLDARAGEMTRYDNYYRGMQPLALVGEKFRKAFGGQLSTFADNFSQLVVDAVEERLNVEGFRIGEELEADKAAWAIWQANNLDAESQVAHTEALVKGESSVIVWADQAGAAQITVEDPMEVVVASSLSNRRQRLAALKRWTDDDGRRRATLFLPGRIEKYREAPQLPLTMPMGAVGVLPIPQPRKWEPLFTEGEPWPLPNPLGVVPVIPLVNRPRLAGVGTSEIAGILPLQDAVNKLMADMIVASEFGAFRQRWATGIDIPEDPITGQPKETFQAAIDRIWQASDKDAKFGEFSQTDLAPYVKAIETTVQHIASITRTPPHYLLGQSGNFPSGESLKATETGLVAKAKRKMRHFGEAWEEVIRLAFMVQGDERGSSPLSETIWRDPETRTDAELTDSLVKLRALNVPLKQLWADRGYTPTQIDRFMAMLKEERALGLPVAPIPVVPSLRDLTPGQELPQPSGSATETA